jgi:hypothetical protein
VAPRCGKRLGVGTADAPALHGSTMLRSRSDVRVAPLFARAVECTGLVERRYTVAGLELALRFAGQELCSRLAPSFEHLESENPGKPRLTVNLWDSAASQTKGPPLLGELVENDESGPVYYYEHEGVRALDRWRTLSVLDASAEEAWFWTPSPAAMASWDWAAPLRAILHWWLGAHGIMQVHGGAIGTPEGGVLVVGRGGSGKSTTALASLAAGLRYAGDDFVAIGTGSTPAVHSLYCSGKLDPRHLERFPHLAAENPVRGEGEKAIVYVSKVFPCSLIAGFPLRAVVMPKVVAREPVTRLVPASAAEGLRALAPSTIFQLYPPHANALAEMAELVRAVPSYTLELGSEIHRIPEAILDLLEATQ